MADSARDNLRWLGVDFTNIRDPSGRPVGEPIVALMRKADLAKDEYR